MRISDLIHEKSIALQRTIKNQKVDIEECEKEVEAFQISAIKELIELGSQAKIAQVVREIGVDKLKQEENEVNQEKGTAKCKKRKSKALHHIEESTKPAKASNKGKKYRKNLAKKASKLALNLVSEKEATPGYGYLKKREEKQARKEGLLEESTPKARLDDD